MKYNKNLQTNLCRGFGFVFCMVMLLTYLPLSASAEENTNNVIRVGAFEGAYILSNEKNVHSGYGYEYLQNIAGYEGWTYEYINSSWETCFDELKSGKIDILGGVSYTEERSGQMLFSDMPMGEERYYIYTYAENEGISASNLSSFDGKNIGVLKDHIPEELLNIWETKNGLHMNHFNISTTEEVLDKMKNHEIDCFVSSEYAMWGENEISPVTSIGESNIYFAVSMNRPELKKALDDAMRRIKDDNPFYTDELYSRYLSAQGRAFLSKEEKDWIEEHGAIKIGYLNNDTGVSMMDSTTGELTGVITDYIEIAKNSLSGHTLEFELKGYNTRSEQLEALHNHEIDLIFHVSQNPYYAEKNGFVLSDTIWTFNMAAITAGKSFDETAGNTIALAKDNFSLKAYISYNYPQWDIKEYDTVDDALQAAKNGKADCFVSHSGYIINYLKNNQSLNYFYLTKPADASFGIAQGEPLLLSIMNKTLTAVSEEKLSGAVITYSNSMRKVTLMDYIRDNFLVVSVSGIVVFALILSVIIHALRKAKKAADNANRLNQRLEKNKKELQIALEEAQSANKAKTSFLSNMSHDIRTPINGIVGMLAIIQKSEGNQERIKDCLDKIEESSKLLLSLINDVLDMAKLESDSIIINSESVNLDLVCQEITETVGFQAEEAGLSVTGEHDDYSNVYVWSTPLYLKKILMNLFTNSMKYNKPNGSISMSMKTLEKSDDYITCEFKIQDTGIGMSEEFIKNKLFVPFVQAENSARSKYTGTGLGMPIVKQLVEKMGGTISVESKLGEGSCFKVVIPFKLDNSRNHESTVIDEKANADISGLHLLLVEDNELNMEIAEFMLEDCGVSVDKALNGQEAVQKFEASKAGEYDAVLMDVMMPVMDGLTAAKTIRAMAHPDAKTIPIIAMTANAFREDVEKCLEAGMNAHMAKPLDIKSATTIIAKCCFGTGRTARKRVVCKSEEQGLEKF